MDILIEITNYFNAVNLFNAASGWKSFNTITEGKYGSRIPVTKVSSLPEFIELLNSKLMSNDFVFCGHRCFDWGLTSTLGRLNENGIVSEVIAEKQLELFKKFTRNRPLNLQLSDENNDGDNYEVWAIGQHYGLMTPLLDWTFSPYVALFFAFAKEDRSSNNPFRAVYFFNKTKISELDSKVEILEPKYDNHGRLVSQAGLFTISPYGEAIENEVIDAYSAKYENEADYADVELAQYLCKVYVPNGERGNILKNLRLMNIHHGTLFPDLQGAADHSNILIEEFYNQQEVINKISETVEMDLVNELPLIQPNSDEQQELVIRTLKISPETVQSIQNLSDNLNKFLTSSLIL
jgi:hypothetical protein